MDSSLPQIRVSHSDITQPECCFSNVATYRTPKMDRYIPNRSLNDLEKSHHYFVENRRGFQKILNFSTYSIPSKINTDFLNLTPAKVARKVNTQSFLVLDAPEIEKNFYFNLLDWSESSMLAVGLGKEVYLWNLKTNSSYELNTSPRETGGIVSSVRWISDELLAIANQDCVELWNVNNRKCISTFEHTNKVTCIDVNDRILTSSSFLNNKIFCHDYRTKTKIAEYSSADTICSLKWNPSGRFLAAGNSQGTVEIRDINCGLRNAEVYATLNKHCSGFKALSWCPWQNSLLATGGGFCDKKINFWNVYCSKKIKTLQVQSQVGSIVWSKQHREILYTDFDDMVICKYPSMDKLAEINDHCDRVINAALNKDEILASLSADETIRLWNVFQNGPKRTPLSVKKLDCFQNIR
ncbi:cell division cycle cofactor of APC complex-like [Brachionus plicatilis]|uniref:Cell division cycle cofactor of APC complex-like n=1 Tax=Brachionus plicatilis TaxID=10195 RepID=A0A3M7QEW9_BRAPC|nr:cell division cycle cofactor of APC complex-like [Brachionus plicatilis]